MPGPPDQPEGTGPLRSPPAPGPSGPGRCWSWPPRPRPRCGPAGSASRRRPGSGWSPRCRASCPSLHLDTSITLPVGVEAYAAYALRAWLTSEQSVSGRTRRFAKWSAICSFALGMAGQVAYHLLAQAGAARAPWPVTTIVSCLPVLVLAMGTALAHMLRADADTAADAADNGIGDQQYRGPQPGPPRTRQVRPRTRPHPMAPLAGSGPSAGTRTAPQQDHDARAAQQSRPASARHAWPPAGSRQREGRYPDGPCAARESRAPTRP